MHELLGVLEPMLNEASFRSTMVVLLSPLSKDVTFTQESINVALDVR